LSILLERILVTKISHSESNPKLKVERLVPNELSKSGYHRVHQLSNLGYSLAFCMQFIWSMVQEGIYFRNPEIGM
jgi:hypothetical protein